MTGFVSPKRESPPLRARRRAAMAAELIADYLQAGSEPSTGVQAALLTEYLDFH
jgi:hypothetical protein